MTKDFKKQSAAGSAFGQYGLGWMVGGVAIGLLIGAGMYALANKGNTPDASATAPVNISTTSTGDVANAPAALPGTGTAQAGNNGAASLQDTPATTTNESTEEAPGFSYHAVLPQLEVDVPLAVQVEQQTAATQQATAKKKETAPPPPKEADKKTAAADTAKPAEKPTEKVTTEKVAEKAADKKAAAPPASVVPNGFNGFQIGSYKTQDQAGDMQSRLKKNGLNARVEQANVQGAIWFRVKIGPASSADMMHKWQQTLSGMGISPMAVRM